MINSSITHPKKMPDSKKSRTRSVYRLVSSSPPKSLLGLLQWRASLRRRRPLDYLSSCSTVNGIGQSMVLAQAQGVQPHKTNPRNYDADTPNVKM